MFEVAFPLHKGKGHCNGSHLEQQLHALDGYAGLHCGHKSK